MYVRPFDPRGFYPWEKYDYSWNKFIVLSLYLYISFIVLSRSTPTGLRNLAQKSLGRRRRIN